MGLLDQLLGLSGANSGDWVSQMQQQMSGGPLVGPAAASGGSSMVGAQRAMPGSTPPQAGQRKMFPAPDAPKMDEGPTMKVGAAPMTEAPGAGTYLKGAMRGFGGADGGFGILGAIGGAMNAGDEIEKKNQLYKGLIDNGVDEKTARLMLTQPEVYKVVEARQQAELAANKPTDDMREYQFDMTQRMKSDSNFKPMPFGDWMMERKKASATQVNVGAGDKAWDVERAKLGAKKLQDLADSANTTSQVVDQMETMQNALNAYNNTALFKSGALAPYELQMRGFLKGLGIGNADTLAGGELARSVQNQMALLVRNPESGMGMPGALSDADRTFLVQTMPGIDKSPQGNQIMIAVAKKAAQRKMEIAALAEQYAAQNNGMEGFQGALKEWAQANPLLDDELKAQIAAAKGAPQSNAPQTTGPNPRAGFISPANAAPAKEQVRRRWNPATGALE